MSQQAQAMVQKQPGHPQVMPLHRSILHRAAINTHFTPVHSGILQRCSGGVECEECRRKRLEREGMMQRAAVSAAPVNSVPPIVHDVLSSSGQPLDAGTRAFMEPRFGHDFSQVRVHTDARAAESARAVNALAYTVGSDVVFGAGQYAPMTMVGKRLMAHELTHVVQQRSDALQSKLTVGETGDAYEQEADQVADTVIGRDFAKVQPGVITSPITPSIQRTCGPKALGSPHPDCTLSTDDVSGEVFYFMVNCDDLQKGESAHLSSFAKGLPRGTVLNVHGYASTDGDASFNMALSCHRANKIATMLRAARPELTVPIPGFKHGATPGPAAFRRSVIVEAVKPTPEAPSYGGVTGVRDLSKIRIDAVPDFLASSLTAPRSVNVHVTDATITHITWQLYDPNGRPMPGGFSTLPGRANSLTSPFTLNPSDFSGASFVEGKYLLRCTGLNASHQPIVYADRDFYVLRSDLTTGTALATTYGDLTFTKYGKTDANPPTTPRYTVDVELQFLPKATVPCNDVTFIQSLESVDDQGRSQHHFSSAEKAARQTSLAWSVDQLAGVPSPYYIVGLDPKGRAADIRGYGRAGGGGATPSKATLIDKPSWSQATVDHFESCVICRSGANRGQVYGCATWGFRTDAVGKVTLMPRAFRQMPSDQFEEARVAWNTWRTTMPVATRPKEAPALRSPR